MRKIFIALTAMALSTGAMAGPSWTYVDLGVLVGDGAGNEDTTGYGLRGSFGFANIWHVQADIGTYEVNGGKDKVGGTDNTIYTLRGGIHPAVTDNTDFVLDFVYTGAEVKDEPTGNDKFEPVGYGLRAGVRSNVGKLELRGFVSIISTDDEGLENGVPGQNRVKNRQTGLAVGGQYNFSDAWSVGLDQDVSLGDFGGAENLTNIYVRWSF